MNTSKHHTRVTRWATVVLLILAFSTSSRSVYADELIDDVKPVLSFIGGVVSAYAIHEVGHLTTAWVTETKMTWETGTYNQPLGFTENAESDGKGLAINAVGLLFQNGAGEFVLRSKKFDKKSKFVQGFMAWSIVNPVLYSLDYWFIRQSNQDRKNGYQGDIKGVEYYSNKGVANGYALSITAIALSQAYRFLQAQSWVEEKTIMSKGHITITPVKTGGIMWGYTMKI